MTAAERAERNARISLMLVAGVEHATIAKQFQVALRTVGRVAQKLRRDQDSIGCGSLDRIATRRAEIEQGIEDLAMARMRARNPRTQIAAIRRQMELMAERLELEQCVGASRGLGSDGNPSMVEACLMRLLDSAKKDRLPEEFQQWLERRICELSPDSPSGRIRHSQASACPVGNRAGQPRGN